MEFKLDAFEGPLDLLLQLIEKNKVDIYDIPIADITDQYMSYVSTMQGKDLELLSDFLVMATTLLDIKAKMLLPFERDDNGEEIDPRSELVARLVEYQEYKMMADKLRTLYDETGTELYRDPSIPDDLKQYRPKPEADKVLANVTLDRLQEVFSEVILRKEDRIDPVRSGFGVIQNDPVKLSDKFRYLYNVGPKRGKFSFANLLEEQSTKQDVVVTFLACLEMIRIGQITCEQEGTCSDIMLTWNEDCETKLSEEEWKEYDE